MLSKSGALRWGQAREREILELIAQGKTNSEIASILSLSPKTVSTYRTRLYAKLGVQNDIELARLALQYGVVESAANINLQ